MIKKSTVVLFICLSFVCRVSCLFTETSPVLPPPETSGGSSATATDTSASATLPETTAATIGESPVSSETGTVFTTTITETAPSNETLTVTETVSATPLPIDNGTITAVPPSSTEPASASATTTPPPAMANETGSGALPDLWTQLRQLNQSGQVNISRFLALLASQPNYLQMLNGSSSQNQSQAQSLILFVPTDEAMLAHAFQNATADNSSIAAAADNSSSSSSSSNSSNSSSSGGLYRLDYRIINITNETSPPQVPVLQNDSSSSSSNVSIPIDQLLAYHFGNASSLFVNGTGLLLPSDAAAALSQPGVPLPASPAYYVLPTWLTSNASVAPFVLLLNQTLAAPDASDLTILVKHGAYAPPAQVLLTREAFNGQIFVLDDLLIPPLNLTQLARIEQRSGSSGNLSSNVSSSSSRNYSSFFGLLDRARFFPFIANASSPLTIFALDNDAIAAYSSADLASNNASSGANFSFSDPSTWNALETIMANQIVYGAARYLPQLVNSVESLCLAASSQGGVNNSTGASSPCPYSLDPLLTTMMNQTILTSSANQTSSQMIIDSLRLNQSVRILDPDLLFEAGVMHGVDRFFALAPGSSQTSTQTTTESPLPTLASPSYVFSGLTPTGLVPTGVGA